MGMIKNWSDFNRSMDGFIGQKNMILAAVWIFDRAAACIVLERWFIPNKSTTYLVQYVSLE